MKILLCGFMGAGKSFLLRQLSKSPGSSLLDLDQLIEQRIAKPLNDLVASEGWPKMRAIESEVLRETLASYPRLVLSLGGGTVSENKSFLVDGQARHEWSIVWLDTPFETCWQRIQKESHRPLVQTLGKDELEQIYDKRRMDYQLAKVRLTPEQWGLLETVDDLHSLIAKIDGQGRFEA